MKKNKIKVLIVDDSSVVRLTLTEIFNSDPEIEVIGTASDPFVAVKRIKDELPDVVSLDIEMPKMDGLTFLRKIMAQHPLPVVMISTLTEKGSDKAMEAFASGAAEVVAKPKIHTRELLQESTIMLCDAIKAAYYSNKKRSRVDTSDLIVPKKLSVDAMLEKRKFRASKTSDQVIAIGSSTGGTEALRQLLTAMPVDSHGMVIVQHMPEGFTNSFANRLNQLCEIEVKEAEDGDRVERGRALIAPGNKHMMLIKQGSHYKVRIEDGPLVNRHRPAVDVLFRSVSQSAGPNSVGIILTGMGDDGAKGLLEMKEAGAHTIAQDEESCVVFGIPKEAILLGAAAVVLPLRKIANHVSGLVVGETEQKLVA
jgi:two-component system chemotaxis response regulator CheB